MENLTNFKNTKDRKWKLLRRWRRRRRLKLKTIQTKIRKKGKFQRKKSR